MLTANTSPEALRRATGPSPLDARAALDSIYEADMPFRADLRQRPDGTTEYDPAPRQHLWDELRPVIISPGYRTASNLEQPFNPLAETRHVQLKGDFLQDGAESYTHSRYTPGGIHRIGRIATHATKYVPPLSHAVLSTLELEIITEGLPPSLLDTPPLESESAPAVETLVPAKQSPWQRRLGKLALLFSSRKKSSQGQPSEP